MGTFWKTLVDGNEGALHLGLERPRVYSDLSPNDKERYNADIQATNILLQGLPKDIYSLINHYTDAKDIWDNNRGKGNNAWGAGATGYGGAQNRVGNANPAQENGVSLNEEQLLFITGGQYNVVDKDVDEKPVQDLALNVDNVFQADDSGLSYDSDILSEYVKDNAVPVVQSNVSSIPNDAYMMILNDMHEQPAQYVSVTTQKLRTVITNRNIKEEILKKELHSVKMQLASTINYNNSMVEEVTYLKKDFKQKENKYLEEFLDMKALKEKVDDK
ncbi:hypothetical protein Tco_0494257 [Tanacetum coccineum]